MNQSQITQTRRERKPNPLALDSNAFRRRARKHDEKTTSENAETSRHAINLRMKKLTRQRKPAGEFAHFFLDAI
jgi:hypothetical protein